MEAKSRQMFLAMLCLEFDCQISTFTDDYGLLLINFSDVVRGRMTQIGIYSFAELSRRLGPDSPKGLTSIMERYDRAAWKEFQEFKELKRRLSENAGRSTESED